LEQVRKNPDENHPRPWSLQHIFQALKDSVGSNANIPLQWFKDFTMAQLIAQTVGLRILSDQPVRRRPRYFLLLQPETPLAVAAKPRKHLLSPKQELGEFRIELQHFCLVHVHQATGLFPVEPASHNFTGNVLVFYWA
jgi:hypothetical protein